MMWASVCLSEHVLMHVICGCVWTRNLNVTRSPRPPMHVGNAVSEMWMTTCMATPPPHFIKKTLLRGANSKHDWTNAVEFYQQINKHLQIQHKQSRTNDSKQNVRQNWQNNNEQNPGQNKQRCIEETTTNDGTRNLKDSRKRIETMTRLNGQPTAE